MTLLRQIQDSAVDGQCPISTLLRKCAVLAARLEHDELRRWVSSELNGYERADEHDGISDHLASLHDAVSLSLVRDRPSRRASGAPRSRRDS